MKPILCETQQTMFLSILGFMSCSFILRTHLSCVFHLFLYGLAGNFHDSGTVKELLKYHEVLRDSIKKLKAVESTRAILVACLKEALLEQVVCWFILLNVFCLLCCLFHNFKYFPNWFVHRKRSIA